MKSPRWLDLSRAVFAVVGAAALFISIGGLTSGESLADPLFPAALALGALSLAAAVLVVAPSLWQASATWLGIGALLLAVGIFGWIVFTDEDLGPDAYALFLLPAAVLVLAAVGMAAGRRRAGALGRPTERPAAR
jgi:hypothetical protein